MCIISILRIVAFDNSSAGDPTYTTINTAMWSSVEQSLGIICACLPTLRPMFRQLYDASQHSLDKSSGSHSHSQPTPIRMSHLGSQGDAQESTVAFAQMPTNTTRSRASSTPQTRMGGGLNKQFEPSIVTGETSRPGSNAVENDGHGDTTHV